jgi:hypothetical protein
MAKGRKLILLLWAAFLSVILIDPQAATRIGATSIEFWHRVVAKRD